MATAAAPVKSKQFDTIPITFVWGKTLNQSNRSQPSDHPVHHSSEPAITDRFNSFVSCSSLENPKIGKITFKKSEKSHYLRPKRESSSTKRTAVEEIVEESRKSEARSKRTGQGKTKDKKSRLSISLSKYEIEEDIFAMTGGSKPSRKPKKRSRDLQKVIDAVCPGFDLDGATIDSFLGSKYYAKVH